jgi:hypothetical protein
MANGLLWRAVLWHNSLGAYPLDVVRVYRFLLTCNGQVIAEQTLPVLEVT